MNHKGKWYIFCILTCITILSIAQICSNVVTTMTERAPFERRHTIIIDAGHGGEDGGALSADGIPESEYNLAIALRLEKLMHLLGYETRMVRNSDVSVYKSGTSLAQKKRSDLKERVNLVNQTKNGLLLSIHQNSYPDSRYYGAQVFYAKTEGSKALAEEMQHLFQKTVNKGSNREIKPANGIYLMEHIQQPGILIECGFLSNPGEARKLMDDQYQKKVVSVIAVSVNNYLKNTEKAYT